MADPVPDMILILEDDQGVAQLERRRLERAGYRAEVVATAAEARRALVRGGVALMVLDYQLNEALTGLEFYRDLRGAGLNVPSILVTGRSDEDILTQAIRAGIRDFLSKTADFLDFLVPTVERVLKQLDVERQLDEAQAQRLVLAEEDRRKDEFLAMLAHELRNPLSAIANAVQLSRLVPTSEQRDWSDDVIGRQVQQLSHLIDDLLDVSRIRLGKIPLRKAALEVSAVIGRAVETVRPLMEQKRHRLELEVAPEPLRVDADPTRLEQVVVNLLTNAAKYTDPGGRIVVKAARESGRVCLRVRDSGVGIAPEMLPRVFDLFIQVEGTLDRSQGGLGIGLTLVKRLVAMHDGDVSVSSDGPGLGSEFVVCLPELDPGAEDPDIGRSRAPASSPTAPRRVLVVDDNADSARGMARLLRAKGHEVLVAHDGPRALEIARSEPFDAVLLDIGLPGMDGYEVLATLKAEGTAAETLIAISGYGQDEDLRRSREAGFDHHLVKPIDHAVLLRLIAEKVPAG